MNLKPIIDSINTHSNSLSKLMNLSNNNEITLTPLLFDKLEWTNIKKRSFQGLFGWGPFNTDYEITLAEIKFVVEVKKILQKSEYGYWHAAIQGLLYRYRLNDSNIPVLCIIFDWGRKAGEILGEDDKIFLDKFKSDGIYFIRLNMTKKFFIEHNLADKWSKI